MSPYSLLRYLLVIALVWLEIVALAGDPNKFYYVSDGDNRLYSVDRNTLVITNIGPTGVGSIEAIANWPEPGNNILYATNAGDFGTIDTLTGTYTSIGEVDGGGTANGALGPQTLNDVDGLAFDAQTGKLWASERKGTAGAFDLLFQIDRTTGLFVPNAFGFGIDYLVVDGTGLFEDIDDIAFNPVDGRIYANSNIGGSNDLLIEINKFTGAVSAVTSLSEDDVEGLSFHNDGKMYGTEGDDGRMSRIAPTTGIMDSLTTLSGSDQECLAALVADASTVRGRVYNDANLNGVDNSDAGISGVTVNLYLDVDSNGVLGTNDVKIQTAVTNGTGSYQFFFATLGYLITEMELSTVPVGFGLTTDNIETAIFLDTVNFGEIDSLNDFGLGTGPDSDGDGIPDFYEGTGIDTDGDGVNNHLDLDSDCDGILDAATRVIDTDADGVPNYLDLDSDNDGISDAIEGNAGIAPTGYVPSTGRIAGADTDGDGLKDAVDNAPLVAYGAGSTSPLPLPDTDHDGISDQLDLDSDNDGITDIIEGGGTDSDGDGRVDSYTDVGGDGFHDPAQSTPYVILNSDSTYEATNSLPIKANYIDSDSDNDGIDDTREGQSTSGYQTAILRLDGDNDGIIDFWDISAGGTSIVPVDTDSDGLDDYYDTDSDNDGVTDFIEGNDANMNGVADIALSNVDADSNGIDDAFDGTCVTDTARTTLTSHAEQQGSSVDIGSSDLELPLEDAEQVVGMYWPALHIGQGENVPSAHIQFEVDETGFTGNVNLTIKGELSTNAAVFAGTANNVTNRTTTTDSVNWTITDDWATAQEAGPAQLSPDISGILQEIVNQGGWTSGSPVVLIIQRNGSGTTRRVAEDDPILLYSVGDSISAAHGCQSIVAVQNSDNDSERDWRDVDDDNDGILTINEDINGNGDWSDDFTQNGGLVPDYLTFSPCPGGTQPQVDSLYATSVTSQSGITNATNALNIQDNSYAEFYDAGDTLVIQLPVTIQAGQEYTIYYKHRNYSTGLPGGATVRMEESPDNVSYTAQPSQPSTFSLVTNDSATLTAQVNTRFLRIFNPGTNPDFDFDAVRYIRTQCQGDNDGDGIADNIDLDDDNDGVPDAVENTSSLDPTADDDNDGVFNYEDSDFCAINSNGVCDSLDLDGDGVIDQFDLDADNDGILDLYESGIPLATILTIDADTNGLIDGTQNVGTNGLADNLETVADNGVINYTSADTDGDGTLNVDDLDSDNDGITDLAENGVGTDANNDGVVDGSSDQDGDGVLDSADNDDAVIGSSNSIPNDSDGDGVSNYIDLDSDNDGIVDLVESGTGTDANNDGIVDGSADADGDGILDSADSDDGTFGTPNTVPTNTDGNGPINSQDLDSDNDGITDLVESGTGTDANNDGIVDGSSDADGDGVLTSADSDDSTRGSVHSPTNSDGNGPANYLDLDSDNDGISDLAESGTGTDANNDGVVDGTTDADGDGVIASADSDDSTDGSIHTPTDTDGNGPANYLDLDSDNDGITDLAESGTGTDANNDGIVDGSADADGDGFLTSADTDDASFGSVFTPTNTDGRGPINSQDLDSDDDGITDLVESGTGTDANNDGIVDGTTDVDGDGVIASADSDDSTDGSVHTPTNTDGNGPADYLDLDSDNDGITDLAESGTGTDANNDGIVDGTTDVDGDGVIASADSDDSTDGSVHTPTNSDADAAPNYLDLDSDNDGVLDLAESGTGTDADNNGVVDGATDNDGDGVIASADSDDSTDGHIHTATDTDGNGPANYLDLDSDNDGITDRVESGQGTDAGNNGIVDGSTDTDGDGILDSEDNNDGVFGSPSQVALDTDQDGVINAQDIDSDNDGITDHEESGTGTDANNDGVVDGTSDADGDGVITSADSDDSTNGSVHTPTNTDSDSFANYIDIDADDDGIIDNIEAQASTLTPIVPGGSDTDGDGLDNAFESTNGLTPVNTESTGDPDYLDSDTDDDGESDLIEGNDINDDGVADTAPSNSDTDGDGLDNSYDNVNGWNSTTNVTNGGQDAFDFPDNDEGDTELDWREVPCEGGSVVLAPDNATTTATDACNEDPWTYYYNPASPSDLLFAIEHMPAGGNTNTFTATVNLTVSANPNISSGVYSAEDIPGQQATFVMGRYWNVSITSGSLNGNVNVRFFYDPTELTTMSTTAQNWNTTNGGGSLVESGVMWFKTRTNGVAFSDASQLTPPGISDAEQLAPASTGTTDGVDYVQFNGLSTFAGGGAAFTVGVNSVILPVELLNFDAIKQGEDVLLNWATATEVNNDYFTIERSNDLKNWEIVGHMDGAGSSSRRIDYSMMDYNPLPGRSYYRLKQTDFNGDYDYSEVREIVFDEVAPKIKLIPNPSNGDITIKISSGDRIQVHIMDATGKIIRQLENYSSDDQHELFVGDLASGSYYVKVISEQFMKVEKLIVH